MRFVGVSESKLRLRNQRQFGSRIMSITCRDLPSASPGSSPPAGMSATVEQVHALEPFLRTEKPLSAPNTLVGKATVCALAI